MTPTYRPQDWNRLTRDEWLTLIAIGLPIGAIVWTVVYGILEWLF